MDLWLRCILNFDRQPLWNFCVRESWKCIYLNAHVNKSIDKNNFILCCSMPTLTRKNDLICWVFLSETQEKIYREFLESDEVRLVTTFLFSRLSLLLYLFWNWLLHYDYSALTILTQIKLILLVYRYILCLFSVTDYLLPNKLYVLWNMNIESIQ